MQKRLYPLGSTGATAFGSQSDQGPHVRNLERLSELVDIVPLHIEIFVYVLKSL
ncbi:hypothetical protein Ana3638_17995 [Anaerocolumna sedimenticola]|uniref:Uncharacterized protein n=1 Tax=Anaerocolumna sedimenticola TaxID=2696063 RepID=A0A6P1TQG5_9FIRM|nr:hypothetical protein [Anaerocolumna sedimenticola]QHQ62442.1 hypothetical protein Ana3638_17995 [Anaerocolumna sedimenticola]